MSLRLTLLLGGAGQFGWFFLGFGMIFVWLFTLQSDWSFLWFWGAVETARGTIVRVDKTRSSEGGGEGSDGTPIYACRYRFTRPDGVEHTGVSYVVGRPVDEAEAGPVTIEFPKGRPERSRVRGMRRAPFPAIAAFPVIFPIIGMVFAGHRLASGRKAIRLLKNGALALGSLESKRATNVTVNDRRLYALTFTFKADDGQTYHVTSKTTDPENLEDEPKERLLYDPIRPSSAVMFDALPGSPRMDGQGQFLPGQSWSAVLLIIPLATVIGHGIWAYMHIR
jgi:hypothetical protein